MKLSALKILVVPILLSGIVQPVQANFEDDRSNSKRFAPELEQAIKDLNYREGLQLIKDNNISSRNEFALVIKLINKVRSEDSELALEISDTLIQNLSKEIDNYKFHKAFSLNSNAAIYEDRKNHQKAIQAAERGIIVNPECSSCYSALTEIYMEKGIRKLNSKTTNTKENSLDQAEKYGKKWLRLAKNGKSMRGKRSAFLANRFLGSINFYQGNFEESNYFFNDAEEYEKFNLSDRFLYDQSIAFFKLDNYAKSVQKLRDIWNSPSEESDLLSDPKTEFLRFSLFVNYSIDKIQNDSSNGGFGTSKHVNTVKISNIYPKYVESNSYQDRHFFDFFVLQGSAKYNRNDYFKMFWLEKKYKSINAKTETQLFSGWKNKLRKFLMDEVDADDLKDTNYWQDNVNQGKFYVGLKKFLKSEKSSSEIKEWSSLTNTNSSDSGVYVQSVELFINGSHGFE